MQSNNFLKNKRNRLDESNVLNFIKNLNKTERVRLLRSLELTGMHSLFDMDTQILVDKINELYGENKTDESENELEEGEILPDEEQESTELDKQSDYEIDESDIKLSLKTELIAKHIMRKNNIECNKQATEMAIGLELSLIEKMIKDGESNIVLVEPSLKAEEMGKNPFFLSDELFQALELVLPDNKSCTNTLKNSKIESKFAYANTDCKTQCMLAYYYLTNIQNIINEQCNIVTRVIQVENCCPESFVNVFNTESYILFCRSGDTKSIMLIGPGEKIIWESCANCFNSIVNLETCNIVALFLEDIEESVLQSLPFLLGVRCYLKNIECLSVNNNEIIHFYESVNSNAMITSLDNNNGAIVILQTFECENSEVRSKELLNKKITQELPQVIGGENFSIVWAPESKIIHLIKVNPHFNSDYNKRAYCEMAYLRCLSNNSILKIKKDLLCDYYKDDSFGNFKSCIDNNDLYVQNFLNLGNNRIRKVLNNIDNEINQNISVEKFKTINNNLELIIK